MELHKIKQILEKYFNAETSIKEEKELINYFSSSDVASELLSYRGMFVYFSIEKTTQSDKKFVLHKKSNTKKWLSIAASFTLLLSIGFFMLQTEDLGTFDDPQIAFIETQKTLSLVAENIDKGKEKIYLLQEYQNAKNKIFIAQKQ